MTTGISFPWPDGIQGTVHGKESCMLQLMPPKEPPVFIGKLDTPHFKWKGGLGIGWKETLESKRRPHSIKPSSNSWWTLLMTTGISFPWPDGIQGTVHGKESCMLQLMPPKEPPVFIGKLATPQICLHTHWLGRGYQKTRKIVCKLLCLRISKTLWKDFAKAEGIWLSHLS